jgi:single-strand DNA-binding protein
MSVNRVILLGNLGADPELRFTPSKFPICNLRIATNERRKSPEGEWVDQTEWHSVVVLGKTAENCAQYLAKGRQVFIEGRLQTRKWQDQEGKDRYKTEILANSVQFIGGRDGAGGNRTFESDPEAEAMPSIAGSQPSASNISFEDDDIPF